MTIQLFRKILFLAVALYAHAAFTNDEWVSYYLGPLC